MGFWVWSSIILLLIMIILVIGPYINLYGREDQSDGAKGGFKEDVIH